MSSAQRVVLSRGFQVALVLLPFVILSGFDHVWNGAGGNGNWSNGQNWTTPTPPDPAETHPINITFPALTPTPLPIVQDTVDITVDSLTFDGHAYILNGLPFQMKGPIVVGPLSIFDDHIINVSIDLAADLSATVTGPNAGLIFNGPIGGAFNVVTGGQGFTVFGAANTYTGTTTIQSGTLILSNPSGFGGSFGGAVSLFGTLWLSGIAVDPTKTINLEPGGAIDAKSGASSIGYLAVPGAGAASLVITPGASLDVQHLNGTGPLTVMGGTFSVSSDSNYGGTITLSGATTTFRANGPLPGATIVLNGATLGGFANVGDVDAFGGKIGPGNSPGILGAGNVTFHDPGPNTFEVEMNGTTAGTGYDQLSASGTVALGSSTTLSLTRTFTYAMGDTLDIISAAAVTGTFVGLPDGATVNVGGQTFTINYVQGVVRLTATSPTPVTLQEFSAE